MFEPTQHDPYHPPAGSLISAQAGNIPYAVLVSFATTSPKFAAQVAVTRPRTKLITFMQKQRNMTLALIPSPSPFGSPTGVLRKGGRGEGA